MTLYKIIGGVEVHIIEDTDAIEAYANAEEGDIKEVSEIDSQEHKEIMQHVEKIMIPRSVVDSIEKDGNSLDELIIGMLHGDRPN